MKNKSIKMLLVAIVLMLGFITSAFVGINFSSQVYAQAETTTQQYYDVRSGSSMYITKDVVAQFAGNYTSNTSHGDATHIEYKYYVGDTASVEGVLLVQTQDQQEHSYKVEKVTKTNYKGWGKLGYYQTSESSLVEGSSGSFITRVYSFLNVSIDENSVLPEGANPQIAVIKNGEVATSEAEGYKVFSTDSIEISVPQIEGYRVSITVDGETVTTNTITGVLEDKDIKVLYTEDTDAVVSFAETEKVSYSVLVDGKVVEYKPTLVISAGKNVEITATVSDVNYNMGSLTANTEEEFVKVSDDEFVVKFTTTEKGEYTVSSSIIASNSSISMGLSEVKDLALYASVSVSYTTADGQPATVSGSDIAWGKANNIKYNTHITFTLNLNDANKYDISVFEVKNKAGQVVATATNDNCDKKIITFTTGVGEQYSLNFAVVETTSVIKLSNVTQDILKAENSNIVEIKITNAGSTTVINSQNADTKIEALKETDITVEYVLAEGYSLNTYTISEVVATTNENTNISTFTTPSVKKTIEINVDARYTRNQIVLDARTQELVNKNYLTVLVNGNTFTDNVYIARNTSVEVSVAMTEQTSDEIESFEILYNDQAYVGDTLTGTIAFDTEENTVFTISVQTNTTENSVELKSTVLDQINNGFITSVKVNNTQYTNSTISTEKYENIVVEVETPNNYKITKFAVYANSEEVAVTANENTYTFVGDKSTLYVVEIETITTDNVVKLDQETISALNNGQISVFTVNGAEFDVNKNALVVAKGSEVTIIATPDNKNLVNNVYVNGNVVANNSQEYPIYKATFVTAETTEYVISVSLEDATNTISFVGGQSSVWVKYGEKTYGIEKALPRNTEVKVVVSPVKGQYITNFSIENVESLQSSYNEGNLEIVFTTDAKQSYVLSIEEANVFETKNSDYVINEQDVILMIQGEEENREIVYNAIWQNVFKTNTSITLQEVSFEYLAGTPHIDLGVFGEYDIDFYYSIDEAISLTKDQLCSYFSKKINGVLSAEVIASVISDERANEIINSLHDFGCQSTEKVKLVYAGSNNYKACEITNVVQCIDLREEITLDLEDEIYVDYGCYLDNRFVIDMLLENHLGAVAGNEQISTLNDKLFLSLNTVGLEVGTYEVRVTSPATYNYKSASKNVKVVVNKATAKAEIASDIVNYQLVQDGTVNKDYIINIKPNVAIENEVVDHVYFVMGLDVVNGELIAKVDLSKIWNTNNVAENFVVNTAINATLDYFDKDRQGLTLAQFVEFAQALSQTISEEGLTLDESYLGKVVELLNTANQAIDVRILVLNDGTDVTPQNHGIYFVGVVTTDKNYNMTADAGYLVITAEIVEVDFVEDNIENNLRKFEYDGTQKQMTAEAYDVNSQVIAGNMKYYYVGIQTDGTFYAKETAPIHAGSYSVYALFNNAQEGALPTQVGLGIGAMIIMPSTKAEVKVENKVHTYNGENVDLLSMVTVNNNDAKVAYITANLKVNGDFAKEGFAAVDGRVNIDFPARFDNILKQYFAKEYAEGVNINNFVELLNTAKEKLVSYGYTVEAVDNLINTLSQMPNFVTITFEETANVNPVDIGVYLVGAVVFDPDYMPKASMGVLVIQPEVTVADMVWNYTDTNGVITSPILTKIDMTATVVGQEVKAQYVYFGFDAQGNFVKVTDIKDVTNGIWLQLAYVKAEIENETIVAMPIARIFVVVPQNVEVEIENVNENNTVVYQYNGQSQDVSAVVTTEGFDSENVSIIYSGVDSLGNKYYSSVAPTNAGVYTVIATYVEKDGQTVNYAGITIAELVIEPAESEVVVEDTVVCYDEQSHNITFVEEENFEYIFVVKNNNELNVVFPSNWNVDFASVEEYLAKYSAEIQAIVEEYDIQNIVINQTMPIEIGEYVVYVIAVRANYKTAVSQGLLTIQDHTPVVDSAVAPTCTTTGLTEGSHCSLCNKVLVNQEIVEEAPHTAGEWVVVEASTCTVAGWEHKLCTLCGKELEKRDLPLAQHNTVVNAAKAPTCTEHGWNEYLTCEDCDYSTYAQIEALGHVAGDWITVRTSTCSQHGFAHKLCTACGEELETKDLEKEAHHAIYHAAKKPTCTQYGWNAYIVCRNCDYSTYSRIEAVGHTPVTDKAVAATCSTTGLTEGKHCSVCNVTIIAQRPTDKIAHTFGDWKVKVCATQTTNGLYERECSKCDHKEHKSIAAYGNKEMGTVHVNESQNGKVVVNTNKIKEAIVEAQEAGKNEVVISNDTSKDLTNIEISKEALQNIIKADSSLTIENSKVNATFDEQALNTIINSSNNSSSIEFDIRIVNDDQLNNSQKEAIEEVKVAAVISAQVLCDNVAISDFGGGKVQVKIPFEIERGKNAEDFKIMYIADDGSIEEIPTSYVNGELVVELEHFSEYVIVDMSKNAGLSTAAIVLIVMLSLIVCFAVVMIVRKELVR